MSTEINLEGLADIVGIATKLHQDAQTEENSFVLTRNEVEEQIREHVGEDVTNETIDQAINKYYETRLRFENPQTNLQQKLSNIYVNRSEIAKNIIRKTKIAAATAAIALSSYGIINFSVEKYNEFSAESNVRTVVTDIQQIRDDIQEIKMSNYDQLVPEQEIPDITQQLNFSEERINQVTSEESVRTMMSSNIKELVTRDNSREYKEISQRIQGQLSPAKFNLERALGVINATRNYNTILDIAVEDGVDTLAQELYNAALTYENIPDMNNFYNKHQQLIDTKQTLGEEYKVIILGGVIRGPDHDPTAENFYLEVQAFDDQGNILERIFDNQETAEYERDVVTIWGERVTEEVYNKVYADKQDDGIINDNIFAIKNFGYLSLDRNYPDMGQITEWEPWER